MVERDAYHHGDLRVALIKAGESVLQETGIDRFSLRQVARKVGVSHSAPAHHFGDANGLLNAIAADGFKRLLALMVQHHTQNGPDPRAAFIGSGIGYLVFAKSAPATFGLMFGPVDARPKSSELIDAGNAAFEHLAVNVEGLTGRTRDTDPIVMQDIMACWSMVHGFSSLLLSGGLAGAVAASDHDQHDVLRNIVSRSLPI